MTPDLNPKDDLHERERGWDRGQCGQFLRGVGRKLGIVLKELTSEGFFALTCKAIRGGGKLGS